MRQNNGRVLPGALAKFLKDAKYYPKSQPPGKNPFPARALPGDELKRGPNPSPWGVTDSTRLADAKRKLESTLVKLKYAQMALDSISRPKGREYSMAVKTVGRINSEKRRLEKSIYQISAHLGHLGIDKD